MKTLISGILLIVNGLFLTSCSSHDAQRQQAMKEVAAPFSSHAITLTLRAEPELNRLNGLPNSCTVLLIQAADKEALEKLLTNPVLLKGLFSGAGAEGAILQIDRYVVMPGQENTLHIDRVEKARKVALVAGYFPFPMEKHIARFDIPVSAYEEGWWNKAWRAELSPLDINVTLGSESIVSTKKINVGTAQPAREGK